MNKHKLARLRDALETMVNDVEDLNDLLNENVALQKEVDSLNHQIVYLEGILEDYGINPTENRLWFITAVENFVRSLGI